MQQRIKEMNEMFPEFPKIEDTLRDIESHLDKIVDLEGKTNDESRELDKEDEERQLKEEGSRMWEETRLTELLDVIEKECKCFLDLFKVNFNSDNSLRSSTSRSIQH